MKYADYYNDSSNNYLSDNELPNNDLQNNDFRNTETTSEASSGTPAYPTYPSYPVYYTKYTKRRKYRSRRKKCKILCILLSAGVILTALGVYFQRNASKMALAIGEATLRAEAVTAINEAVFAAVSDRTRYEDLVIIRRDGQGNISSLAANPLRINKLARETSALAQEKLKQAGKDGIPVPMGALTGIEALVGFGPNLHINIIPIANVLCVFSSEFIGAGVNQTKHSVYLNAIADISIVTASRTKNFSVTSEILIAECVLIGDIPEVYLQSDPFGKYPSLTPRSPIGDSSP